MISEAVAKIEKNLNMCFQAMHLIYEADKSIVECGCAGDLAGFEKSVLNLVSSDAVQSLLYISVIVAADDIIVRYV